MSKEVAKTAEEKPRYALNKLAARLAVKPEILLDTLKKTAFKECRTNEEFTAAVVIANEYQLNPFLGEIYAFPGKGGGVRPIVPIDGWIKIVRRQPDYDGVELIENEENGEDNPGKLKSVTAIFYLKGKENSVKITEYMAECFDGSKEPWKRWPRRMLRHKAYIQGARVAFGLSGIYDPDEAERIYEAESVFVSDMSKTKGSVSMPQSKSNPEKAVDFGGEVHAHVENKNKSSEEEEKILWGESDKTQG